MTLTPMTRLAGLALVPLLLLTACGKAKEAATEKAVEKMIESQIEKEGGKAKVDLSEGKAKITTTDAKGQTTVMEMGGAQVSASDVGLAFYPGAQPVEKENQRIQTPEQNMVTAVLESKDSTDQIAAFYRDKLRAMASGKTMMDNASGKDVMMILSDEKSEQSYMVNVHDNDEARRVTLTSVTKLTPKP